MAGKSKTERLLPGSKNSSDLQTVKNFNSFKKNIILEPIKKPGDGHQKLNSFGSKKSVKLTSKTNVAPLTDMKKFSNKNDYG